MIISTLNHYHGDSSACIVVYGKLIAAVRKSGLPVTILADLRSKSLKGYTKWQRGINPPLPPGLLVQASCGLYNYDVKKMRR